jgi:hypothetical protein
MLILRKLYEFLIYVLFEVLFVPTMKENYIYISQEDIKEEKENSMPFMENIQKDDSPLLKEFRSNIAADLSTDMEVLEKMERLWFIFPKKVTEEEKIDINTIVYSYGIYPYWDASGKDELRIELFSLEKLEEIRRKHRPPVFPNTFRLVEEDEEEYHAPPPKKEERKPNYWYRSNENFKKPEERRLPKKKEDDGWTTVSKRK